MGKNFHDHSMVALEFKLKHPEQGLVLGSPPFMSNPEYLKGWLMDWIVTM